MRLRAHGGVAVHSPDFIRAELNWTTPPFAVGYRNDTGRLTHFILGTAKGESGPYTINVMSYETTDQLLQLFALLKLIGDQVRTVKMAEPAELQVEDLLRHPVRSRVVTKGSDHEKGETSRPWWQARILDVGACVAKRRSSGTPVRFNLELSDPLQDILQGGWKGVAGSYVIAVGPESSSTLGTEPDLPTMKASVGAFTRMWIGVRPATSLALTDEIAAPGDLLAMLDEALQLPVPHPGMYF